MPTTEPRVPARYLVRVGDAAIEVGDDFHDETLARVVRVLRTSSMSRPGWESRSCATRSPGASANLGAVVHESLPRDALKESCVAINVDDTGKARAVLVERILAAGGAKSTNDVDYAIDAAAIKGSNASEGGAEIGALLRGLDDVAAPWST